MTSQTPLPARDLALIAVFAGITAALGLIPPIYLPISPAPITAQSLGPMLAGAILGGRRGGASLVLFMAMVALGLPLLSGGRGGIGVFLSPTVGFLVGFVVCAFAIGWATYRVGAPYSIWKGLVITLLGGLVLMYIFGLTGMMIVAHLSLSQALLAQVMYLPGDLTKAVIAVLVAKGVHTAYPGLLPWHRQVAAAGSETGSLDDSPVDSAPAGDQVR